MMKPTDAISGVDRRSLLLGAGGTALAGGARAEAVGGGGPLPSKAAYMTVWSAAEKVELWPNGAPGADAFRRQPVPADADPAHIFNIERPALHVFRSPRPSGQGLLVIPGGAYHIVSVDNEGMDVADRFNPSGLTVFVLSYRLPGEGWARRRDVPLQDAQRAMRLIRSRAEAFGVDPGRLSALGFSAGGHLTASLATGFDEHVYAPVDAADQLSARPYAVGLIYPVIMMEPPFTHRQSRDLLLGPDPSPADVAARSPVRHVGAETPPLFLAHAMDDDAVPVDNTLLMMAAMREAKRPVEAHLFQEGRHAFGVGRPGTPSELWPDLFARWLDRLGTI